MPTTSAKVIPNALRLQTSIGSTPAMPAQIIVAPAIGEIVRPRVPPKAAIECMFTFVSVQTVPRARCCFPRWTQQLPAQSRSQMVSSTNGPKVAAILTIPVEFSIQLISALISPKAFRPATKTPTEIIIPLILSLVLTCRQRSS